MTERYKIAETSVDSLVNVTITTRRKWKENSRIEEWNEIITKIREKMEEKKRKEENRAERSKVMEEQMK
jgi:hypothetical protein